MINMHMKRIEMALHDAEVIRNFATGVAGLSVVADSLSAIKHAKVKPIYDEESGLITDFEVEGDFPKYGNNIDEVDQLAVKVVEVFMDKIRKLHTYRNSVPTMSVLTITSNVVYGKKQEILQTVDVLVKHLHQVQIQCTEEIILEH